MDKPRTMTKEEVRELFLDSIRVLVDYWDKVENVSQRDKIDGVAFSILNIIDGMSGDFPCPLTLVTEYSEEDKQYCIENGKNYVEDSMAINDDVMLHEIYYKEE